MNKILITLSLSTLLLAGCNSLKFGETYSEEQAGYTYIPLEPTAVSITNSYPIVANAAANISKDSLLNAFPDNSVRIATRQISGKVKAGVPSIGTEVGYEGSTYEIIIDFVNTQTINKQFQGKWFVSVPNSVKRLNRSYPYEHSVLEKPITDKYESWTLKAYLDAPTGMNGNTSVRLQNETPDDAKISIREAPSGDHVAVPYEDIKINYEPFNVPVYVGIGLRLKATVTILKGTVNITSLPALTAAVEANQASGTMSVQTIGITGRAARSNLLLLDKIDTTTIQNAVQVLASIKASIESSDTTVSPRIVGFHNTIGAGPQGINLIHSLLASDNSITLHLDPDTFANGATDTDSMTSGN